MIAPVFSHVNTVFSFLRHFLIFLLHLLLLCSKIKTLQGGVTMCTMAKRIKESRLQYKLTQEELAEKLGLQKSAIAKYENGRVENIKRTTIEEMAKIFNCAPSYLMGWDDQSEKFNIEDIDIPWTVSDKPDNDQKELNEIYVQLSSNNRERVLTYSKSLLSTQQLDDELATATQYQQPTTLAAHHEGTEYTEDELKEIDQFKKMVENKRK